NTARISTAYVGDSSHAPVNNIRNHTRQHGVAGSQPRKPPGRTSAATPAYRQALREAVTTPPQTLGYGFSVWSVARLNEHLKRRTKISFREDQWRRLLHQEGFSYQRPKHTMKGKRNEAAFAQAQQELKALKKSGARRCSLRPDLPGRDGNPPPPRTDTHVGARRPATRGAGTGQEREKCRVRRRGL